MQQVHVPSSDRKQARSRSQDGFFTQSRNHGSQRRHRGRRRIATGRANVFGFCSGALPFVTQRKNMKSLWLPARVVAVPAVSRFHARMRCGARTLRLWQTMWPRSDVRAATSPASRIAYARKSLGALRAADPGRRGKADAAKAKLGGLPSRKPAFSKSPTLWPREPQVAAATLRAV